MAGAAADDQERRARDGRGHRVCRIRRGRRRARSARFVVSGASKRGWTTWTTAAVDRRVVAIVPAVIDMLNVEPSFVHHWRAYGAWSEAVKDYVEHGIMDWMGTPQFRALMKIEEPYEYRDRLTMPKLMRQRVRRPVLPAGFVAVLLRRSAGEKHLRYVPNTVHSLDKSDALETRAGVLRGDRHGHAAAGVHVDVRARRLDQGRDEAAADERAALAGDEPDGAEFPPRRRSAPRTRARR